MAAGGLGIFTLVVLFFFICTLTIPQYRRTDDSGVWILYDKKVKNKKELKALARDKKEEHMRKM